MKLSTRTRYGVRLMVSLAAKFGNGPVLLKDIAKEQEISEKYLSLIVIPLKASGLVQSTRGAHGGYTLARDPSQINVKEIVDVLEGETRLVDCVKDPAICSRVAACATRDMWAAVEGKIAETLRAITLGFLVKRGQDKVENSIMSDI